MVNTVKAIYAVAVTVIATHVVPTTFLLMGVSVRMAFVKPMRLNPSVIRVLISSVPVKPWS